MNKKTLAVLGILSALTFGGTGVAQAASPAPATTVLAQEEAADDDSGDSGLWGLAGLLGLIGLAGLKKRPEHRPNTNPGYTNPGPPRASGV